MRKFQRPAVLGTGSILFIGLIAIALQPAHAGAQANTTLSYTFNTPGVLYEAASASNSTSPYFWLASGAKLIIENGIGETIQGALPASDPWKTIYATKSPTTYDSGAHPQNTFLLLARDPMQNGSVEVYFDRVRDNLSNAANRQPYNGESLIARYQNSNTYYYAGIRADGMLVIKKKTNGVYQTLAQKQLIPGTYNATTNPDLIPLGAWIGLKFSVSDTPSGAPLLDLSTDLARSGSWQLALSVSDEVATYGAPIKRAGLAGIENDYADARFENFLLIGMDATAGQTSPAAATYAATWATATPTYDAVVLADKPALYLAMNTASSGTESDKSGHGLNGVYRGGTPSAATLPNGDSAADFNGSSEYVSVPSNAALSIPTTHQLTWEGWVRADTFQFLKTSSDGYVDWMGKCQNYSPTCEWEARIYGSSTSQGRPERLSAYVFNSTAGLGSAADWQPDANVIQAGKWVYVVAEYQTLTTPSGCSSAYPGTINIWVNGVKQDFGSHAPTGCMSQYKVTPKAANSPLTIGTMGMDTFFKGAVGKVAVYDSLLTQSQINAHFKAMTGLSPSGSCGSVCTAPSF